MRDMGDERQHDENYPLVYGTYPAVVIQSTATSINKGSPDMLDALRFDSAQRVDCAGTRPWTKDFDEWRMLSVPEERRETEISSPVRSRSVAGGGRGRDGGHYDGGSFGREFVQGLQHNHVVLSGEGLG